MNLIYTALLLNSAGKDVNEENVKKIASAVGTVDDAQVKALVSALEGVNIKEVIEKASMPVAVAAAPVGGAAPAAKDEGPSEADKEKRAEDAAEGLSSLFG
ncbi:MAG: 50S ribosomal protein P1 [Candidatus Aenigmarchaeota archaeon]|nr:50S ribosomal protein P1 [Candidatus Aenigmarchaeota archaeon]